MPAIIPPTNVVATNRSSSSIFLTWTNTNNSLPIEIWLKQAGGIYQYWATQDAGLIGYVVIGLSADTHYYFKLRYAGSTLFSDEDDDYTSPLAPADFVASVSGLDVSFSWTNSGTYASLKIDYYTEGGGWKSVSGSISGTATSYGWTAGAELTDYIFRIAAESQNSGYWSSYILSDSITTGLTTPTGLEATCPDSTSVYLTWADNSSQEDGYEIYQDNSLINTTDPDATSYLITGLTTDQSYKFKVRAKKGSSYSQYSNEVEIIVGLAPDADPVLVSATPTGQNSIVLTWTCAATNETGFEVWRSADGSNYTLLTTIAQPNATTYEDTGLTSNTAYYYKIRAYNSHGYSGFSSSASGTTEADLDAPTGLIATALNSTSIRLDWINNALDASCYYIERKTASAAWSVVGYTADGETSYYIDGTASPDTDYLYRVRAYNVGLDSYGPYSVAVACRTPISEELAIKDNPYIGMGSKIYVISEEPQTSFESYWRSKPLDFGELDPKLPSKYKTVDRVRLDYVDKYASTPITVGLSTDDGETWTEETLTIGEGDGTSKHADFWFEPVTGRTIAVRVKHSDSDTAFEWTGLTLYFLVRGDYA